MVTAIAPTSCPARSPCLIDVEHGDAGDQLLVGILRGAHDVAALTWAINDKRKVALDRLERRCSSSGLARVGLAWQRNVVEDDLVADQRAVDLQRGENPRMNFAEVTDDILRPYLDGAGATRMKPCGPPGHDLQCLHRRAGRGQGGKGIGLGVEHIDRLGLARPMTAGARGFRQRTAHAARRDELVFRFVALEDLPDLEQRDIGIPRSAFFWAEAIRPAAGSAACRRVRPQWDWRAPVRADAAEQLGFALGHEGPRHSFDETPRRQGALGLAGAQLDRREHGLARIVVTRERRRGYGINAGDAYQLLNNIGTVMHIRSP